MRVDLEVQLSHPRARQLVREAMDHGAADVHAVPLLQVGDGSVDTWTVTVEGASLELAALAGRLVDIDA